MNHIDHSKIDVLRDAIGDDALRQILRQFFNDANMLGCDLKAAIASEDSIRIKSISHKISGLFGQVGIMDVAERAEQAECAQNNIHGLAIKLMEIYDMSVAEYKTYYGD